MITIKVDTEVIQVAAGVVVNTEGEVLLAKRPLNKHQGGLWEFPGGKIEPGESAHGALSRELEEEVGISIAASEPLIRIQHAYPDKTVCLNVLRVDQFLGEAWGREGQDIAWVAPEDLPKLAFPAANKPIVTAVRLPRQLMITGAFDTETELLDLLRQGLSKPVGMVQFRAHGLDDQSYIRLARKAHSLCKSLGVPMIANCAVPTFREINCEGLHLTSPRLCEMQSRPVAQALWLSAACHNAEELRHAEAIGVDFVSLSPVRATATHAGQEALGWEAFGQMLTAAKLPVYALGGMREKDLAPAVAAGAQGIAAIGEYWQG